MMKSKHIEPVLISDVWLLYTERRRKQQFLKARKDNQILVTRVHDIGR